MCRLRPDGDPVSTLLGRGIRVIALRHTVDGDTITDWRELARCRDEDPELFFPIGRGAIADAQTERAKQVCRRCPVRDDCYRDAMQPPVADFGVFGGTDEHERRKMRPKALEHICPNCDDLYKPRNDRQHMCYSCEKETAKANAGTRTQLEDFLTEFGEQLRRANAEGVSDKAFAKRVGHSHYLVGRARQHLGLPVAVRPQGR